MKTAIKISLITFLFIAGFTDSFAQNQTILEYLAECERKYGEDLDLVNGEKYFYPYSNTDGDPFLNPSVRSAAIHIKGKFFEGQKIRYDIYNQQLVLEYEDVYGGKSSLVIRNEWVESFSDGDREFRTINGPEESQRFYQLIHEGQVSCYYSWRKDYLLNLASGERSYYFTEPIRDSYLVLDDQFYSYRSNRTLLKILDKGLQKEVKLYLRQNGVNVKRSPDRQMNLLFKHINTLLNETS
jgi:hypothetical protein